MKVLVYGAGVIGTLYAAKLQLGGHHVTVLARGARLADIRNFGLVIENILSGVRSTAKVETTEQLCPDDEYDVALITVRRDQLASVIPALSDNRRVPTIVFMLNNPLGTQELIDALGGDRVLLGFPGAGGTRDGNLVSYSLIAQQPTTLGELSTRRTDRLLGIVAAFRGSGFPSKTSRDMDAWLKAHAFFVTAVSGAIYLAGGNCHRLSEEDATLGLMTKGVREGFNAVKALGLKVFPLPLRVLFMWLPQGFAVAYWRRFFSSDLADYVFGRHARNASIEMLEIVSDCRTMLKKTGASAPALRTLYAAVDTYAALAAGSDHPSA